MNESLKLSNESDRAKIVKLLSKEKVGLFPTDTVYGICCSINSENAVSKIFNIKGRERDKPLLILSDSIGSAEKFIDFEPDPAKQKIINKYWPGPLTIVFKANKKNVPDLVRASGDTVAVRIPDYSELRDIISSLGVPIVAPSANISGKETPSYYKEVDEKIMNAVDFVVKGKCKMKVASTILDFTKKDPEIIRRGAVEINI